MMMNYVKRSRNYEMRKGAMWTAFKPAMVCICLVKSATIFSRVLTFMVKVISGSEELLVVTAVSQSDP